MRWYAGRGEDEDVGDRGRRGSVVLIKIRILQLVNILIYVSEII